MSGFPPRKRRSWVQRAILACNMILIVAAVAAAGLLRYGYERASDIQRVELSRSLTPVPDEVAVGERVLNILLVGSDSSAGLDASDPVQIGRQGERFGDVIIVAHVDERSRQMALLSFPRDLWVSLAGTNRSDRINRAFEVGGPAMLIDTIEQNFDIPIHHYVNVDFAGFQGLVEAVGSVEVYFDTPARDWNVEAKPEPRSQTGFIVSTAGCHALDPATALAYVRSRYYQTQRPDGTWETDPSSDFGRIARQQDFLRRLMYRAIELGARNPFVLSDLVDTGLENVAIDGALTPQVLLDLGTTFRSFDPETLQTYSFPVADAEINGNQVLQPLSEVAEPLLALLRGAAFDDPSTIAVSLITPIGADAAITADAGQMRSTLESAGFPITEHALKVVQPGTVVAHGPNGAAAAAALVDRVGTALPGFADSVTVRQVDQLAGRSVQIRLGGSAVSTAVTDGASGTPTTGKAAPSTGSTNPGITASTASSTASSASSTGETTSPTSTVSTMTSIGSSDGGGGIGGTTSSLIEGHPDTQDSKAEALHSDGTLCGST